MSRQAGWRPPVQALLCVALTVSAGLLLAEYFDGRAWWWPVGGAAVAGGAIALLRALRRCSSAVAASVVVLGGAIAAALVVLPPVLRAGDGWLSAVPLSLARAWPRMLTSGVPARPTYDLLVLPVVLSFGAAAAAALMALRWRALLVPLLPPFLLFVIGLMLTPTGAPDLGLTTVFLALALTLTAVRASAEAGAAVSGAVPAGAVVENADVRPWGATRRLPRIGHLAMSLPLVAATGVLGVLGAAVVPETGDRFDPRSVWQPPVRELDVGSPLLSLKSRLSSEPSIELFTATVRSDRTVTGPLRLRTAALDRFDGYEWTTRSRLARPAARLPIPAEAGGHGARVDLDVRLGAAAAAMERPFLPVVGVPTGLRAEDAEYDPVSGSLALPRGTPAGYRYSMTAWLPVADTGITAAAAVPATAGAIALDLPPELPTDLTELAADVTKRESTGYDQLKALEAVLRAMPYSLDVAPGSSYAVISQMMNRSGAGRGAGFAEQHAAAFAAMARGLNFPARVSVGYLVPAQRAATGRVVVTTKDAHAWPEVYFAGYGWIPFEPTDVRRTPGSRRPPPQGSALPTGALDADPTLGVAARPRPPGLAEQARSLWPWAAAGLGALLLAVLVGIPVAKWRRRSRRRRASTAAHRVLGAWSESLDRLAEAGWRPEACLSPPEVAAGTRERFGDTAADAVEELVPLVEEVVFGGRQPPPDQVKRAWSQERRLTGSLDQRHRPPMRRLRHLDPRPLQRRTVVPVIWRRARRPFRRRARARVGTGS